MSENKGFSVVSLGDLGKLAEPINTLIEKVSDAVGGIFEPIQVKRLAEARAEAAMIDAKSELAISDLQRRALHRLAKEEARKQKNIEDITQKAFPHLVENSEPNKLEEDWVANFFDKSRIVSDEEMQEIWAKVLAGEANAPGSFSKRTVNFLSSFDKVDAELFSRLCGFCWEINGLEPIVYNEGDNVYKENGINFEVLTHLASIGLIQFETLSGFAKLGLGKMLLVKYCNSPLLLNFPKDEENEFSVGKVMLTNVGRELVKLVKVTEVPGFRAYCEEQWKQFTGVSWKMVEGDNSTTTNTCT